MADRNRATPGFTGRWVATLAVPAGLQIALSLWIVPTTSFGSAALLFWVVVIAASLCAVTSVAVLARSFASDEADLGSLGLFFYAVSVLPLVHGLTTPGVLFDANTSTMTSVLLAIPTGLIAVVPFALSRRRQSMWFRRHWRAWVVAWVVVMTAISAALLIDVDLLPAPTPRQPFTVVVAILSFLGCALLSKRHLRMARIAGSPGPLAVSAGYGLVGSSAFVWLSTTAYSTAFWTAHALDIVGVFGATIGALVVYRRTRTVRAVLRPVLVTDPLSALEVGLDPLVHRFVADLETKDRITRDHVVRTSELAVSVGEELQLGAGALRRLGLTAILHDVGKLSLPDEILTKPGRLTDAEFETIQKHAAYGARLVAESPALDEISAGIRGHHERIDGRGYPDGLVGDAIPDEARIVAVCDAFDAMANTRQYREGMRHEKAIAILKEHAGSQWDPVVVAALVAVVRRDPPSAQATVLDQVGREGVDRGDRHRIGCDCDPEPLLAREFGDEIDAAQLNPV